MLFDHNCRLSHKLTFQVKYQQILLLYTLYLSFFNSQERYYGIVEKLETLHADPSKAAAKTFAYDADHERRRKEQLCRLYDRTPEQVEEEEILRAELKKVNLIFSISAT